MPGSPEGEGRATPEPISQVFSAPDLELVTRISGALTDNGLRVQITPTPEQKGDDGNPLGPDSKRVALSVDPEYADIALRVISDVISFRDKQLNGLPPELAKPGLESKIHGATMGVGLEINARKQAASQPARLAKITEDMRVGQAKILTNFGNELKRMLPPKKG